MKIDYQDISAFIEYVMMDAKEEGIKITTVEELCDYLVDNDTKFFRLESDE